MNPRTLVKLLRGSNGQILWAIYFAWHAMDLAEIKQWTGLKRDSCYDALNEMEGEILASQIMAHGRKVWFLKSEMLPIFRDLAVRAGDIQVIDAVSFQESTKPTPGGEALIIINSSSAYLTHSVNNNNKGQESTKRTPGELEKLGDALGKHKIVGSKRAELIACEHVTADYVRAHVEFALAEGRAEFAVGIAINRMLDRIDQPGRRENGHIENCACGDCSRVDQYSFNLSGSDDDEEIERHCIWKDDLDEIIEGGPLSGSHRKGPECRKLVTNGSIKWCDEHLQIGIGTFGS